MMSIRMTRIDPERNMARFYEIDVQPGLFGDVSVSRHWGRIGSLGQSTELWFSDETAARDTAQRVETQKVAAAIKRGWMQLFLKGIARGPHQHGGLFLSRRIKGSSQNLFLKVTYPDKP